MILRLNVLRFILNLFSIAFSGFDEKLQIRSDSGSIWFQKSGFKTSLMVCTYDVCLKKYPIRKMKIYENTIRWLAYTRNEFSFLAIFFRVFFYHSIGTMFLSFSCQRQYELRFTVDWSMSLSKSINMSMSIIRIRFFHKKIGYIYFWIPSRNPISDRTLPKKYNKTNSDPPP